MEKIQSGFRIVIRIVYFLVLAVIYLTSSYWIHLTTKDLTLRRRKFSQHAGLYTRLVCRLYNIKIDVLRSLPKNLSGLIVGNHMGFVDILVMHSLTRALFVTSEEMHSTPVLGPITEMSGCIYVERRNKSNLLGELKNIVEALKSGFSVTLYPEATSHNGEEILPFKRTLLTSAALAGKPIIPYCFNFKSIDGDPFSLKNRDFVCWYGSMTFLPSFLKVISLKEIIVEVTFLDPYFPKPDEDRAFVADEIRKRIVEKFKPVLPM